MRLLQLTEAGEIRLTALFFDRNKLPPYAVLSHTWGAEDDEVSFEDMRSGSAEKRVGYKKLKFCAEQAQRDSLQYFWVDTCCINNFSSSEVHEAVNSMFSLYQKAAKCYVYLADIGHEVADTPDSGWQEMNVPVDFESSRWFRRGWTLQELLAPPRVEFFTRDGEKLGDKSTLEAQISKTTGIPREALRGELLHNFAIEDRIEWQVNRETAREEDKAYSLLGIFDVHMPLIYGEGTENAFKRLRKEIAENSLAISTQRVTFGRGLVPARLSCTFEHDQLDITPADEPFLQFGNGVKFLYTPNDDLIIHHADGRVAWQNGRWAPGGSAKNLVFQRDGNLVSYKTGHHASWASNTQNSWYGVLVLSSAQPYLEIFDKDGRRVFAA